MTAPSGLQLARQAIYDRRSRVIGYELLFRGELEATPSRGEQATSRVVVDALMEIGLDTLVGDRLAFVNASRTFLVEGLALLLPPQRTVIEVLEDVDGDSDVVEAVRELVDRGHTIALDDFRYRPELEPLLPYARIVKVEVDADPAVFEAELARARSQGATLLAEKVETRDELELARRLGCAYFQGYVFERPSLADGHSGVPPSQLTRIRLLTALHDPDVSFEGLEQIVSTDVSLSYRLLRFINSAALSLPRQVMSIHEVLVLLGMEAVRRWATVITLADVADKPRELLVTGLVRARMCELLAEARPHASADGYFLAGLLSVLDALVDTPLDALVAELPLAREVTAALLDGEGEIGAALATVLAYEDGAYEHHTGAVAGPEEMLAAYVAAVVWASTVAGSAA